MIVVAGEALVDLVIDPVGEVTRAFGGGPYNTARTLGRLGSHVAYFGAVSLDRFGSLMFRQLEDDGVDTSLVQRSELPTSLAAAELDASGSASYRFYFQETAAPNVQAQALPRGVEALHLGTLGLVVEPMASVLEALVLELAPEVLVVVDINCRPSVITDHHGYIQRLRRVLARTDVVKVSTEDLEYLDLAGDVRKSADALLQLGAQVVLHTDGGEAVHVHTAQRHRAISVTPVKVVDTIGAGDAFGGAFLAWWSQSGLQRAELHDLALLAKACEAAVVVSGVTCTRVGADPPTAHELGDRWSPSQS